MSTLRQMLKAAVLMGLVCLRGSQGLGLEGAEARGAGLRLPMAHSRVSGSVLGTPTLRPGALATAELHLAGLAFEAPQERIDVPQDAPFRIPVTAWLGGQRLAGAALAGWVPSTARLEATLSGPGLSAQGLEGGLEGGLLVHGLPQEGDYLVSDLRVVDGGRTLYEATPRVVQVRCLGQVIISSVTSSPMTMDEIRDAGIQLEPGNYEGRRFTMALSIGSNAVQLTVPVAIPKYNGYLDPRSGSQFGPLEISGHELGGGFDVSVVAADMKPSPGMDPFTLSRPVLSHSLQHRFKALLVIPGSIGYLHQFYKTNLVVLNTLPEGSPYKITHLTATLKLPVGADAQASSAPLRVARRDGETDDLTKPVLGPDSQGRAGQGVSTLQGGQAGMATYFLEALKEGAHAINFDIRGQFEGGGLTQAVPLAGTAQGKLLVRNPYFNLVLVHPDVVRKGEVYTLEARLTNTSETLANGVSLSLDKTRLGSVKVVGDASQTVDTLKPGETASFKFQLRALRNGEIRSSYLYIEDGTIGFQLSTGLGERHIRLNPDTLVLPKTLNALPETTREAMLRVLGQAYSVATTQGALPPGVWPISRATITGQMSTLLTEQGLFLKMGVDKRRIWWSLWRAFMGSQDTGFDQLVRTTQAGHELRQALLEAWSSWAAPGQPLTDHVLSLSQWTEDAPGLSLVAIENAKPGLGLRTQDAQGRVLEAAPAEILPGLPVQGMAWASNSGRHLAQIPTAEPGLRLQLVNHAQENQLVKLATLASVANHAPTLNRWEGILIPPGGAVTVDLGAQRGASASGIHSDETVDRVPEPFQVLAVHRYDLELDAKAAPYGTQVMVLFNRPNKPESIPSGAAGFLKASSLVQVEENRFLQKVMGYDVDEQGSLILDGEGRPLRQDSPPALIQAFPRVLSLYLEKPVGPYIPRSLTLSPAWTDRAGEALSGVLTWPIVSGYLPGGAVVKGKVRKAQGQSLPAKLTYYYYQAVSDLTETDLATNLAFAAEDEDFYYAQVTNMDTLADGTFQLDYVPEPVSYALGPFLLQGATAEGSAWGEASVLGNGQVIEMDLVLEGQGTVEGFVVDGAGRPVAGARVRAIQEQRSISKVTGSGGGAFLVEAGTDAQGFYRLPGLKTGVFSIRALKDLFGVAGSGEIPSDGSVVTKNLILKGRTGTLRARLLGLDGLPEKNRPLALGIPAGLRREGGAAQNFIFPTVLTPDAEGWVRFEEVPCGDVKVVAAGVPINLVTAWQGYLDSGATLDITLRRLPAQELARVRYRVVDAKGQPVAGAFLSEQDPRTQYFAVTDEEGCAPFRSIPADRPHTVKVYHPLWLEPVSSETVVVQPGEEREARTVLPSRSALKGRVTRADGTPVAGAYVAIPPVYDKVQKNRLAITDARGEYLIPSIPTSGSHRLAAVGPELRTATNVQIQGFPDETLTVDLVLPLVGKNTVQGTVFQPLEGAQRIPAMAEVWVQGLLPSITTPQEGNERWGLLRTETTGVQRTGADGKFRLGNLPQGAYTLFASSDIFPVKTQLPGDFAAQVNATEDYDLFLISSFAGELKGTLTQRDGHTPVPVGTRVRLLGGSIGELIVHTVEGGRYAFAKVIPAGSYLLRAEDPPTGDIAVAGISMKKEESQVRNLRLWGRGTLTVKVEDSFGNILSEGDVTLVHAKAVERFDGRAILTEDDLPVLAQKLLPEHQGTLVFEDLLEGPVTVKLRNPVGRQGVASVTLPEGGGGAQVTVRLQPVGFIRGMLKRADGSAVPAGRVDAYRGADWLGVSTTRQEGEDGRFLFALMPVGTLSLEAWDPDTRQVGRATVQIREGETTGVEITTLDKGPVEVTVTQEGQPVLRAGIRLQYRGGAALAFSTEATTDNEGRAQFVLPPGDYHAAATDPITLAGGQARFSRANNQLETIPVAITLAAVRSLWVTALPPPGAPAGSSMEGWSVRVIGLGRKVLLDAEGQGLLRDLTVGTHTLELTDPQGRFRGNAVATLMVEGGALQTLPAPLAARAMGSAVVEVVDASGRPVSDATCWLQGPGKGYSAPRTDLEGRATFLDVLAGDLRASCQGAEGTVSLASEGERVMVRLQLPPVASIHGRVQDALGQPAPFVQVAVGSRTTATDAAGAFRMAELPLDQPLKIVASTADGSRRANGAFTLTQADQDLEVNLAFAPVGILTGTIADPLRPTRPLAVTLKVLNGTTPVAEITTDGLGRFQIPSLPAGVLLNLKGLLDDGRTVALDETFTLEAREGATQILDLTLPRFTNVKGWTLDSLGRKIPMTVVLRDAQGQELGRAVTTGDLFDPDHPTFFFRHLKAGETYRLDGLKERTTTLVATLAHTPSGAQELETVELRQPTPSHAQLALTYPDGSPAPGPGRYTITSLDLYGGQWVGDLGPDGRALVNDLPGGSFRCQVSGVPNQPTLETTFTLTVPAGGTQEVAIPAGGRGTVRLWVKTASGRVLRGGTVALNSPGLPAINGLPQADGSHLLEQVWTGRTYHAQASGFGLLGTPQPMSLATHGQVLEHVFPAPDQFTLTGRVLDAGGSPVSGALVELVGKALTQVSDAAGQYGFHPLAAGTYTLRVTLPGRPNRTYLTTTHQVDGTTEILDLPLKGTGAVSVQVLREDGTAFPGQVVTLKNTSPFAESATLVATSDTQGLAAFPEVLEGSLQASATLEGRLRSTTGALPNGGTLSLTLRARDVSRIAGRVVRAAGGAWPAGTVVRVKGQAYPLLADGTLVPPTPEPLLEYTSGTVAVEVALSNGAKWTLGHVPLVLNGITPIDFVAPAFGVVQGRVRDVQGALVPNALVQGGALSFSTDAQGAYRLEGLPMGTAYLVASVPGRIHRGTDSTILVGDGELRTLDLRLKGSGSVTVQTLASDGSPLAGQTVGLRNNSSWSDGTRLLATSDATGKAAFPEVLEGSISVDATLETLSCTASGTLGAGQTLALTLKPQPYTTLSGRVRRANTALTWPQGTKLRVSSQRSYNLASDGSIQIPDPNPRLDYGTGISALWVDLPSGSSLALPSLTLVKNGETVVEATAPAFGTVQGTVKNPDGTPVQGATLSLDGARTATSGADGTWAFPNTASGTRRVTARTATAIATGETPLSGDDGVATLNLILQPNTVSLPVNLALGRKVGSSAAVLANGSVQVLGRTLRPSVSVDGAAGVTPTAPGGIAQWQEKNRQITYTVQQGGIEITVLRTVGEDSYLLRDEIRLRNTDAAPHRVQFETTVTSESYYGESILGVPSGEYGAVLTGPERDAGLVSNAGACILWGDGPEAPESVRGSGYYNTPGAIAWPAWDLAPGEEKAIALAVGPYRSGGTTWRASGASRMLDRIRQDAPEWRYASGEASWANWAPAQAPQADALPAWNASMTVTVKDAQGRVPWNASSLSAAFEPSETLAPRVPYLTPGNPLTLQPSGGGRLTLTLPGAYPRVEASKDIPSTEDVVWTLVEGASLVAEVRDARGVPVPNATVSFGQEGSRATGADGDAGPVLLSPGEYELAATLPNSGGMITARATVQALAGADNRASLAFPATGSLRVRVLGPDGLPYTASWIEGHVRDVNQQQVNTYNSTGTLEWPRLLPGTWTLTVQDPRTSVDLPAIPLQVQADTWTEQTVQLSTLGQLQVQVLTSSGGPAARSLYVVAETSVGSTSTGYTDDAGRVTLTRIPPGPVKVRTTNPQNGFPSSVTVTLPEGASLPVTLPLVAAGTLNLSYTTTDGRPASRGLQFRDGEGWSRWVSVGSSGTVQVSLPVGRAVLLEDQTGSEGNPWTVRMPARSFTLSAEGEQRNHAEVLPLGKLTLRVKAGETPQSGVSFSFEALGWTGYPDGGYGTTGADGTLTVLNVPLQVPVEITARRNAYSVRQTVTLTTGEGQVDFAWPQSNGKVLAHVRRANGQTLPLTWTWTAQPLGETGGNPPSGHDAQWNSLPTGTPVTLQATGRMSIPLTGWNGHWDLPLTVQTQVMPTDQLQEVTLTLPALASARLRFVDAQGQTLTGSLGATYLSAWITQAPRMELVNKGLMLGSFEDGLFSDTLPEGDYTLELRSDQWGPQGTVSFTVQPADDGRVIEVPVTLDWTQTPYAVRILAGDQETPVPGAWLTAATGVDGRVLNLGYMPDEPDETSTIQGAFWGPRTAAPTFGSRYQPHGQPDVETSSAAHTPGQAFTQALVLPLTVLRARITETDGGDLERFEATLPSTDPDDISNWTAPQAVLGGTRWSLILGQPAGETLALTLADADSGLGTRPSPVPLPVPRRVDLVEALPEHAWITSAHLQSVSGPHDLHLAVSRTAPGLVRPDLASWVFWQNGQEGIGVGRFDWSSELVIDASGSVNGYVYAGLLVPRIRVPLEGSLWGVQMHPRPNDRKEALLREGGSNLQAAGTFGLLSFALQSGQTFTASLPEAAWTWVPTPVRIETPGGVDPQVEVLLAVPDHAPEGWRLDQVDQWDDAQGPDAQGLWRPRLPVGVPLKLETQRWDCGTWWHGVLQFTPTDPPPAQPRVIQATTEKGTPCTPG